LGWCAVLGKVGVWVVSEAMDGFWEILGFCDLWCAGGSVTCGT